MKRQIWLMLGRLPRLKALLKYGLQIIWPSRGVSTNYVEMNEHETGSESARLRMAWQNDEMPAKQRDLVDRQLAAYRDGERVDVFDVLVKCLRNLVGVQPPISILEIGCSSGYYSEVCQIAGLDVAYTGCDYSEPFVEMARQRHPHARFDVQDATALAYADNSYEVVISGCCLLHIPEYQVAVAETVRVASRYAIFHRTPVVLGQPTKYYRKQAYGVETVEIHFNESEFLDLLADCGLELLSTHTLDQTVCRGVGSATRTYVCGKKAS